MADAYALHLSKTKSANETKLVYFIQNIEIVFSIYKKRYQPD